jgi:quercetin dioxygenase-like cupin family protein
MMSKQNTTSIHAVQPDEGEAYWRPKPANGYVVVKISPRRGGQRNLAMGIQVIPPGGFVPEHSHEKQEEILFCFEGAGVVELDGVPHEFGPGTTIYATQWMKHKIINTGACDLKFTWTMTPPGLEDFFSAIGKPRQPGEPAPAPFDPPATVDRAQAEAGFGDLER